MKTLFYTLALLIAINLSAQDNHMDLMTTITGEFNGSRTGKSVVGLDFNGDGIKDLVVLSDLWNPTGSYSTTLKYGKMYFYFGGASFDNIPEYSIPGTFNKQFAVSSIYNAGDVNGDGKEDIAMITGERVIPPDTNQVFSLYIFYGRDIPQATPDYTMNIDYSSISSIWLSPLGDINNDGYDDLSLIYSNYGRIYWQSFVLLGYTFEYIPFIENHLTNRGLALSGLGDVNNDEIDDFHLYYPTSYSDTADIRLTIYFGSSSFPDCDSLVICNNTNQIIRTEGCALGDVNGDGIADFASNMAADAKVWFGRNNLSPTYDVVLSGGSSGDLFGGSYYTSPGLIYGDLNGDGFDDVIGSDSTVLFDNGRAGIWMGRAIFNGILDLTIQSPEISEQFGYSKAAGDFDADGYCDVAISAPGVEGQPLAPGYVYVYSGNAELADTTVGTEDDLLPIPNSSIYDIDVYPNPFKADATIDFTTSGKGVVKLMVINTKGQLVRDLCNAALRKGDHTVTWDGRDNAGRLTGSGIYLIRMSTQEKTITRKAMMIK